jgi:crotonobetainyl-CoA:carnitine CoA-transferase CaiB-like acyl-CoA transferase
VVKIEEPLTGDEARRRAPFLNDVPHPERSGLFLHLNTSKRAITLNIRTATGKDIFKQLVNWADVLIEDRLPRETKDLGLDYESLKAINPRLIMTSITPFGQTGPYRDYKAYNLNTYHSGGEPCILYQNSSAPDRAPVKGPGLMGDYDCGLNAALVTLGVLYVRGATGPGQHIDISKQESLASLERLENVFFANREREETAKMIEGKAQGMGMVGGLMPCKDGYVVLTASQDNHWRGLVRAMGDPEWALDERYEREETRTKHALKLSERVRQWMQDQAKEEIFHRAQRSGTPLGAVYSPEELVNSPQLRARGFFARIDHPEAGEIEYPTAPYQLSKTPWAADRPAPLLGEHNEEIYVTLLGYTRQDMAKMRETGVI